VLLAADRSKRSRPHGLPGAAGGASRTARHDRARDRQDRMADRPAARTAAEAARSTSPQPPARSASNRCRQPTGLDSPRSPFSTPISTSAASIAASSLSLSDSAQAVSAHWTDAISASSSSAHRRIRAAPVTHRHGPNCILRWPARACSPRVWTSPAAPLQQSHDPDYPHPIPLKFVGGG
jgi:hypothetical protein